MRTSIRAQSARLAAQRRPAPETVKARNDRQQAETTAAATDRAIEQLKRFLGPNQDRKIVSLTREEVACVAVGAVNGYLLARNKQEAAERLDDPIHDLFA